MGELFDPCEGTGWVCETHHAVPWRDGDNCCGAPGMPCLVCNGGDPPRHPPGSILVWDFKNNPPGPRAWSQKRVNDFSEPRGVYHFARPHLGAAEAEIEEAREASVLDAEVSWQAQWQNTDHGTIARDLIDPQEISRRIFRASARQTWGQSVTDDELQDEALDDLYHELGIKREDP